MIFKELFKKLSDQLKEKNILFEYFLREAIEAMNNVPTNPSDWQDIEMERDHAIGFYNYSFQALWDMAVRLARDSDDPVYDQATEIMSTLCDLLNDEFDAELQEVQVMSPSKQMAKQGLVEIVEENGQKFVKLTKKGEDAAKGVEKQIEEAKYRKKHEDN